ATRSMGSPRCCRGGNRPRVRPGGASLSAPSVRKPTARGSSASSGPCSCRSVVMGSPTDAKLRRLDVSRAAQPPHARLDRARSEAPLYAQVVRVLKDEIVRGLYPVGSRLPTEDALCRAFSVRRYTVREALRRLREDQLVSPRQGAGTTVIPPRGSDAYVHEVTEIDDLVTFATGARFAIDAMEMITADAKLARRIGGAPGHRWLAVRGFRHADDGALPICHSEI